MIVYVDRIGYCWQLLPDGKYYVLDHGVMTREEAVGYAKSVYRAAPADMSAARDAILRGKEIADLPGLPASISALPDGLLLLSMRNATLPASISALPDGLMELDMSNSSLPAGITRLPAQLRWLHLRNATLPASISALPGGLRHLSLRDGATLPQSIGAIPQKCSIVSTGQDVAEKEMEQ